MVLNAQSLIRVDSDSKNKGLAGTQSDDKTLLPITLSTPQSADAGPSTGDRIYVNGQDTNVRVLDWDGTSSKITMTSAYEIPKDAAISFYPPVKMGHVKTDAAVGSTSIDFEMSLIFSPDLTPSNDDHIYVNGVDTGILVQGYAAAADGNPASIDISKPLDFEIKKTDEVTFYAAGKRPLNMTLVTPAGTEIPVVGISNIPGKDQLLATTSSHVEVYASVDDKSLNKDMDTDYYSSPKITPNPVNSSGYQAVAEIRFMGGRNIDALELDPQSGNPKYKTMTKLTALIQNAAGGKANLVYDLDLTDTTLQSSAFQVTKSVQDGQPMSKLSDVTIDSQGRIAGVYGNGKVRYVGQIALVHFDAFEQLAPVGKNAFAATVSSGTEDTAQGVLVGHPGTGEFGDIKSQALESSNVDLSSELVRLMILQRTYSANSQSMKAVDQVMRDTLQMIT